MKTGLEIYHDFYGCHATIRTAKSGASRLTVRTGAGKLIKAKDYTSRDGALRAMRRLSDCWTKR